MVACYKCKQLKPKSEYYLRNGNPSKYCKSCYMIRYRRSPEQRRQTELKRKYKITLEQYNALVLEQGSMCAICGEFPEILHVDHDHKTKKVRGLLCGECNMGIGKLKDDPLIVAAALFYLEKDHVVK